MTRPQLLALMTAVLYPNTLEWAQGKSREVCCDAAIKLSLEILQRTAQVTNAERQGS